MLQTHVQLIQVPPLSNDIIRAGQQYWSTEDVADERCIMYRKCEPTTATG